MGDRDGIGFLAGDPAGGRLLSQPFRHRLVDRCQGSVTLKIWLYPQSIAEVTDVTVVVI